MIFSNLTRQSKNSILHMIFLSLSGLNVLNCQKIDNFPVPVKGDPPNLKISSVRTFNGSSLFGYMDGGAELYLEYGFEAAAVMDLDYQGSKYKLEIYKMSDPESAFGIYSVSKFRCPAMPPDLSDFACLSKYQLQICKGAFYINIINRTGSSADSTASVKIGKIIADKIIDTKPDFSSFMAGETTETIRNNYILVKGRLGIINGAPDLEDLFTGITDYRALIIKFQTKKVISIKFGNDSECDSFLKKNEFLGTDKQIPTMVRDKIVISSASNNHLLLEIPEKID